MKPLKLALLFAAVIACIGSSCPKKIKTTSLIVHANYSPLTGISEGGKIQWVSDLLNGPAFKVHIYGPDPCGGSPNNDLPGKPGSPAVCTLNDGTDGTYAYAVLPPAADPNAPGITKLYFHTDVCKLCDTAVKKMAKHPTIPSPPPNGPSNPPPIEIACYDGKTATADPPTLQVSAGQLILWAQVGPDATTTWQVSFPRNLCVETPPFGTISNTTQLGCTVSAQASGTYPYDIEYCVVAGGICDKSTKPVVDCVTPAGGSLVVK